MGAVVSTSCTGYRTEDWQPGESSDSGTISRVPFRFGGSQDNDRAVSFAGRRFRGFRDGDFSLTGTNAPRNVVYLADTKSAGVDYSGKSAFGIQPQRPAPGTRVFLRALLRLGPLFRGGDGPRGNRLRGHLHMGFGFVPDHGKRSARIEFPFSLVFVSPLHMVHGGVRAQLPLLWSLSRSCSLHPPLAGRFARNLLS